MPFVYLSSLFFVLVGLNNNCINNDANVCAFLENAK